jgi:hypothetical protein
VSVDTNVKGKNLAPYRKLRHERFQILVAPTLVGLADSLKVVTRGPFGRKLGIELAADHEPGCDTGSCAI